MARGLSTVLYNDDAGNSYSVRIKAETVAQASLGWAIGAPANGSLPRRMKMRHVEGIDSSGFRRSVPVGDLAATAYVFGVDTFTMRADDGTVATYTITGRVGEKVTR